MKLQLLTGALALATAFTASAQSHVMEVNTAKPGAAVQSTMYGIFFEDINFAADGGLYAEMGTIPITATASTVSASSSVHLKKKIKNKKN